MLETELKCIIAKEVYDKVRAAFDWDNENEQINYYYTDEQRVLRKNRVMVRVRARNNSFKLQVKLRKNADSPLQICEETEYDIGGAPIKIPADTAKTVTGLDVGELVKMGGSKTLRSSLTWDKSTEICLDKTDYFDVTDYEIEIEYKDKVSQELINKLLGLGVVFKENSIGKFSRFLKKFDEFNK